MATSSPCPSSPAVTVESVLWELRGERLRVARERARAAYPRTCRACGSDQLVPAFPSRTAWECGACGLVFEPPPVICDGGTPPECCQEVEEE